jgi:hypothetical protein
LALEAENQNYIPVLKDNEGAGHPCTNRGKDGRLYVNLFLALQLNWKKKNIKITHFISLRGSGNIGHKHPYKTHE